MTDPAHDGHVEAGFCPAISETGAWCHLLAHDPAVLPHASIVEPDSNVIEWWKEES